ncbi:single-stranded DNA-binding protein [Dyella choica]|uniref:Single-stranded DNA-binding protein n=1 Tax=Dyella choica TaxID=1927959 RepID=A0A3S0SBZ4_9GAMM|nr:single-stranded DNA-binding protein [Dyella choica]RUL78771.1 hypothetical protein EKH80_02870 [Dyella choica]
MSRVIIKDTVVQERQYKDRNGAQQILREQRAVLDQGDGYGLPFRIGLGTGSVYPMGDYEIDPSCFSLGRFGDLELSRYIKLKPVKPVVAVAPGKVA